MASVRVGASGAALARLPARYSALMARASRMLDLPGDVVAGLPRIELIGSGELRMEGHRGILAYGPEEIHISGGKLIIKVRGSDLELKAMNASQLLITGDIAGIELT